MKKLVFVLAALMSIPLADANAQNTYVVDQGGGGTHTTIIAAVATAVNGDTIKVLAGTYSENVIVAEKLIFIGQAGTEVVSGTDAFQFNSGSGGSVLNGFILRGRLIVNTPYPSTEASRIIIANNELYDNAMDIGGVVTVFNNKFTRLITPGNALVFRQPGIAGSPAVIFGNTFRSAFLSIQAGLIDIINNRFDAYSPATAAIDLPYVNSGVNYGTLKIIANVVDSCTIGMSFMNCNVSSLNRLIANNVITNCPTGMSFPSGGQDWQAVFHNNVIHNSTTVSVTGTVGTNGSTFNFYGNILSNCAGNVSLNNDVWDYNCIFSSGTVPAPGIGNFTSNPLFVNPSGGDFNLQGGSPGINAGAVAFIYTDIDKTRNNMGVYGGPYSLTNFPTNANPKVIDLLLSPASVIQGNNITITGKGTGN